MPAVSEAQRKFLYAHFGAAWVKRHHFANDGPLPMFAPHHHAQVEKPKRRKK